MGIVNLIKKIGRRQDTVTAAKSIEETPVQDERTERGLDKRLDYTDCVRRFKELYAFNTTIYNNQSEGEKPKRSTIREELDYESLIQLLNSLEETVRIIYTPLGFYAIFRRDYVINSPKEMLDFIRKYHKDGGLLGEHYYSDTDKGQAHFICLSETFKKAPNDKMDVGTLEYFVSNSI